MSRIAYPFGKAKRKPRRVATIDGQRLKGTVERVTKLLTPITAAEARLLAPVNAQHASETDEERAAAIIEREKLRIRQAKGEVPLL